MDLVNSVAVFTSNDTFDNRTAGLLADYAGVADPTRYAPAV